MTITAKRNGYGVSTTIPVDKVQHSTVKALEALLVADLDSHEVATRGKLSGNPTEFLYET